jgi:hypothetical protein
MSQTESEPLRPSPGRRLSEIYAALLARLAITSARRGRRFPWRQLYAAARRAPHLIFSLRARLGAAWRALRGWGGRLRRGAPGFLRGMPGVALALLRGMPGIARGLLRGRRPAAASVRRGPRRPRSRLLKRLARMSGWTTSCVLHSVLVLVFTLLYMPQQDIKMTLEAVVMTPQPAIERRQLFEETKSAQLFWKIEDGDSRSEVKPIPLPKKIEEPEVLMEDREKIHEPSAGEAPARRSALPATDLSTPLQVISGRKDGQVHSASSPGPTPREKAEEVVRAGEHLIGSPKSHKNLTVFVIRGRDKVQGRKVLTLSEAMEQKKVMVHETGNVNELIIENCSAGEHVFVQAGEIVKGGKQDRVLASSMLLPPKSGRKQIPVFCVESGRWQQRPGEDVRRFSSSKFVLATKDLKLAARHKGNQGEVWEQVAKAQKKLTQRLGRSVRDPRSGSSLQLTLEDPRVRAAIREYVEKLRPQVEKEQDAVGFAFAIDGKVNSADVYSSPELFRKLWPKLLEAAAVEALAEGSGGSGAKQVDAETIKKWFEAAEKGRTTKRANSPAGETLTKESRAGLLFETLDGTRNKWIHRNYIAKHALSTLSGDEDDDNEEKRKRKKRRRKKMKIEFIPRPLSARRQQGERE